MQNTEKTEGDFIHAKTQTKRRGNNLPTPERTVGV